jgi:single-strand DNA-binding protein
MNKVFLRGNLTRKPEVKTVGTGDRETQVANFTIAVNRFYQKRDGEQDKETTYVDCEAWDSGAKHLGETYDKGDPILAEGSLKLDSWETDGQRRSKLKVRVSHFERLYRKPSDETTVNDESQNEPEAVAAGTAPSEGDNPDIPF